jgi:hypothetical protein
MSSWIKILRLTNRVRVWARLRVLDAKFEKMANLDAQKISIKVVKGSKKLLIGRTENGQKLYPKLIDKEINLSFQKNVSFDSFLCLFLMSKCYILMFKLAL